MTLMPSNLHLRSPSGIMSPTPGGPATGGCLRARGQTSGPIMSQSNGLLTDTGPNGVRDQADALLDKLIAERARSERRLAEAGRADPFKMITGRSAIDNAIAATREMIRDVDEMVDDNVVYRNGTTTPLVETIRTAVQTVR